MRSMNKTLIIIGAGPGIGTAVAERFGKNGYQIGLVSRNVINIGITVEHLQASGITAYAASADVSKPDQLKAAISELNNKLGNIDVVLYNAAVLKSKNITQETGSDLIEDFKVNVGGALDTFLIARKELSANRGALLITGGGLSDHPSSQYGSLSMGKAALKSLALQLHMEASADGIYVGLLTITNALSPNDPKYSPSKMADQFWEMVQLRTEAERAV